jgi:hypothetical protein
VLVAPAQMGPEIEEYRALLIALQRVGSVLDTAILVGRDLEG